ncbi:hypothetical protein K435DRAFT_90503 [Dendrothele bispora CBS 962.96]|uniref:F-box domain-containing protein n=1 Tax=Dendrothele bispora (strain CBS 962.96) TaxID=1314807 RepID=A0A4S8M373_DENBC|nr:hypothetical protein K435DRAFT_90503 [Dendrothele bispora CBS 962.96]
MTVFTSINPAFSDSYSRKDAKPSDRTRSSQSSPSPVRYRVFRPPSMSDSPSSSRVKLTTVCANKRLATNESEPSSWSSLVSERQSLLNVPNSPIRALPNEVMIDVFKLVVQDSRCASPARAPILPAQYLLSHVSRHWRALVHNTPMLWQELCFAPYAGTSPFLGHLTKQWLTRAQGSPSVTRPIDILLSDVNVKRTMVAAPPAIKPITVPEGLHISGLDEWIAHVEARLAAQSNLSPTLQIAPLPTFDFLLPSLIFFCESWRTLRLRLPSFSYAPSSGPLGLLQYPALPLPQLELLDLEYSYSSSREEKIELNRNRRLVDDSFVPGKITTFAKAPKLKHVRLAYDHANNRKCNRHDNLPSRGFLTDLEVFDLPYEQLETLGFVNIAPEEPMHLKEILAKSVNLEKCALVLGELPQTGEEESYFDDVLQDFNPAVFKEYSFGVPTLEETDDFDAEGETILRPVLPPSPPTLCHVEVVDSLLGHAKVALLSQLRSLRLTLHGNGGAAQLLQGFSFPALEELSIIHTLPDVLSPLPSQPARAEHRLDERAMASAYPHGVIGSSLLRLQQVSSSLTSLRSLRLENVCGITAAELLQFIKDTGDALRTIDIRYCPDIDVTELAEGLRADNDELLAPNLVCFRLEADLALPTDDPDAVVDMLATRICPGHATRFGRSEATKASVPAKMVAVVLRFFDKDWTEQSKINLIRFKEVHGMRVGAKCHLS